MYFPTAIIENHLYRLGISKQKEHVRAVYKPSFAHSLSTREQLQQQLFKLTHFTSHTFRSSKQPSFVHGTIVQD